MKNILSTKKLSTVQKDQLLQQGVCVVDYDAISVTFLDFDVPEVIDNAIFTSQQAVRSFLEKSQGFLSIKNCFCVGQKTKSLLEENGLKVIEIDQNAEELAQNIAKNYKKSDFYYFCGTIRMNSI